MSPARTCPRDMVEKDHISNRCQKSAETCSCKPWNEVEGRLPGEGNERLSLVRAPHDGRRLGPRRTRAPRLENGWITNPLLPLVVALRRPAYTKPQLHINAASPTKIISKK